MIISVLVDNHTIYYGVVFLMNLQNVTKQEILTETLRVLNEIKLENLGFPQEIIDSIRSIPSKEVQEKLKPIEFENYVGWIGQFLKSPAAWFSYHDYLNMYREEIKKFLIMGPAKSPDFAKFEEIPNELVSKIIAEINDTLAEPKSTFMTLLKLRKQVVSYADKFLPKYGVKIDDTLRETMFEKLDFMIQAMMNDIKQGFIFATLDSLILIDYRYFTTKFEKQEFISFDQMRREADRILEEMEDESKVMNVPGMPKDFYWYNIGVSSCSIESQRMGHCGRDSEGILFSLRRKSKGELVSESHVTISYNVENATVLQIKGKGNAAPLDKYWPMVAAFFKYVGVEENKENGRYSASGSEAFYEMNEYLEQQTGVAGVSPFSEVIKTAKDYVRILQDPDYTPRHDGVTAQVSLQQDGRSSINLVVKLSTSFSIVAGSYGDSSFGEMSDYAADYVNEVIEQVQKNENYDLYQGTSIKTSLFVGSKEGRREELIFETIFEYGLSEEAGDESYLETQVEDFKIATKYLITNSDYIDEAKKAFEGLYEEGYLTEEEGIQASVEQLQDRMSKNPHVVVSKDSAKVSVKVVQTRADGYAFRYDFDDYYDSFAQPVSTASSIARQVASAVMENIKENSNVIVKNFLIASKDLIADQLDLFRTGEPIDIEAALPFVKTGVFRKGDDGYTLELSFVFDKATSVGEVAQVAAITEYLSENYSYFVEYLDKTTDQTLERALLAIQKRAVNSPATGAPTSYDIKTSLRLGV